jgi:prolyl 4-hydroxylase
MNEALTMSRTVSSHDDDSVESSSNNSSCVNEKNLEEEEEEEEESFGDWLRTELRQYTFWREHAVAILVALVATLWWHYHNVRNGNHTISSRATRAHAHLPGFARTANISFCHGLASPTQDIRLVLDHAPGLSTMDFDLPLEYIGHGMMMHYHADAMSDNDYQQTISQWAMNPFEMRKSSPELSCLLQRYQEATQAGKSSVKGHSYYYPTPTLASMYRQPVDVDNELKLSVLGSMIPPPKPEHYAGQRNGADSMEPAVLSFTGFAAKFVNLSPQPVLLYWDGRRKQQKKLIGEIAPMETLGTATTPGQSFSVTPVHDSERALARWVVTADDAILVYEPADAPALTAQQQVWYAMHQINLAFAREYLIQSGRLWLAHWPRPFASHPGWPAEYFGQTHAIALRNDDTSSSLQVASVAPRVFTMDQFLSLEECATLRKLALSQGLQHSTVSAGSKSTDNFQQDRQTRSSVTTWMDRNLANATQLMDSIYRRAAQVLRLDPALLDAGRDDHVPYTHHALAESLQIVRYRAGEQYTAHHDFSYPSVSHRLQPTRHATLLIYLNDDYTGGDTVFPRAMNRFRHDGIRIRNKNNATTQEQHVATKATGSAVLFYNQLPDGNVDDLSQHASEPVTSGEKWIATLWVWDPVIN